MTGRAVRAALICGAILIVGYAIRRPAPFAAKPAELFTDAARASWSKSDTRDRGETFDELMRRGGLDAAVIQEILTAAPTLDPRRMRARMPVEFRSESIGAAPNEVVLKLAIDSILRISRDSSGRWSVAQEVLPWEVDTVVMHGAVPDGGSLRSALVSGAEKMFPSVREQLYNAVASVYEYRVDMSRDLQPGDSVDALLERARGPDSTMRVRRVLATRLFVGGKPIEAYHFPTSSDGKTKTRYFDATGKSLATAFLKMPIEFSRISSSFGSRFHPILKIRRMHAGTDYAAVSGTPVRSIADGRVLRAVYNPGGYGNMVEVQHPNGLVSRYAHLRAFASGIRTGTHVDQGQTIGYVGATGLATAPHLHFEILVGGKQTNPAKALKSADGTPLASEYRARFDALRGELAELLGKPEGVVRTLASAQ